MLVRHFIYHNFVKADNRPGGYEGKKGGRMETMLKVKVNNLPSHGLKKRYVVARYDENTKELWYFGTYEEREYAEYAISQLYNGLILERG